MDGRYRHDRSTTKLAIGAERGPMPTSERRLVESWAFGGVESPERSGGRRIQLHPKPGASALPKGRAVVRGKAAANGLATVPRPREGQVTLGAVLATGPWDHTAGNQAARRLREASAVQMRSTVVSGSSKMNLACYDSVPASVRPESTHQPGSAQQFGPLSPFDIAHVRFLLIPPRPFQNKIRTEVGVVVGSLAMERIRISGRCS